MVDKLAGFFPISAELAEDGRISRAIFDRAFADASHALRFGESRENAVDLIERGTARYDWLVEDDCGDVRLETVAA